MFELSPFTTRVMAYDPFFSFGRSYAASAPAFRTDVREEEEAFVLEVELPGFSKEEIDVSICQEVLTVLAEKKTEEHEKTEGVVRSRRQYGRYHRRFDLSSVESESISGRLENGILTLTLPKKKKKEPETKRILIS